MLEQMVNVVASALVIASVVIASALVLLVARESLVRSARFLRLCIGANFAGIAACVMWLMGLQNHAPHLMVFADVATTCSAAIFAIALAARRRSGVVPAVVAGAVMVALVGVTSTVLERPDALAWKCAALAVLCAIGVLALRGQGEPRWFSLLMGAALAVYTVYCALRAGVSFLGLAEAPAWTGAFGATAATAVGASAFAAVGGAVLALHAGALRHSIRAWTQVTVDD